MNPATTTTITNELKPTPEMRIRRTVTWSTNQTLVFDDEDEAGDEAEAEDDADADADADAEYKDELELDDMLRYENRLMGRWLFLRTLSAENLHDIYKYNPRWTIGFFSYFIVGNLHDNRELVGVENSENKDRLDMLLNELDVRLRLEFIEIRQTPKRAIAITREFYKFFKFIMKGIIVFENETVLKWLKMHAMIFTCPAAFAELTTLWKSEPTADTISESLRIYSGFLN